METKILMGLIVMVISFIPLIAIVDYQIFKWIRCKHCDKPLFVEKYHYIVPTFLEIGCFTAGIIIGITLNLS